MRRRVRNSLIVIVVLVVILGLGIGIYLKTRKIEMITLVPGDALVYLWVGDMEEGMKTLQESEIYEQIIKSKGWEVLKGPLEEMKKEVEEKTGLKIDREKIIGMAKEAGFVLLPPKEDEPSAVLLLLREKRKERLMVLLAQAFDKVGREDWDRELRIAEHEEYVFNVLYNPMTKRELCYIFFQDIGILSLDRKALFRVINLYQNKGKDSLARQENFKEIRKKFPKGIRTLSYFNIEQLVTDFPQLREELEQLCSGLLIEKVEGKRVRKELVPVQEEIKELINSLKKEIEKTSQEYKVMGISTSLEKGEKKINLEGIKK